MHLFINDLQSEAHLAFLSCQRLALTGANKLSEDLPKSRSLLYSFSNGSTLISSRTCSPAGVTTSVPCLRSRSISLLGSQIKDDGLKLGIER